MPEAKFVDETGLATYTRELKKKLSKVYTAKGNAIYADTAYLASPVDPAINSEGLWQQVNGYWTKITSVNPGWVYNMSNSFTSTTDFIEGAGREVAAGTNIVVVNVGTENDPVLKFDILATSVLDVDMSSKQNIVLGSRPNIITPNHTVADATARTALTTSTVSDGNIVYQEDTEEYYYADVSGATITWYDIGNTKTVEGALKLISSVMPTKSLTASEVQAMF